MVKPTARRGNGKVLAVIPSRLASARLPRKPLVDIAGKPMIQWVYERAAQAKLIDKLVVATDSPEIYEAVIAFGGEALMTSPDHQSGTDRLVEAAQAIDGYDVVLNVQGDEPMLCHQTLDLLIEGFLQSSRAPMGTLVKRTKNEGDIMDSNSPKVVVSAQGDALYFSRSPIPYNRDDRTDVEYFLHIGVYIYDRDFLLQYPNLGESKLEKAERLEQLRALEFGHSISVFETESSSIGVDTPADLERVRKLLSN
jgi:3-deoxy-manno-octulosonate cytidylyltransferase (CMP-KDO synthetase)